MHQADRLFGRLVAVVLDALHERAGAVSDSRDRNLDSLHSISDVFDRPGSFNLCR
jgi:hypothetical protein